MPNQPGNIPTKVHREKLSTELGKMPFYGKLGNCTGAYYFRKKELNLVRKNWLNFQTALPHKCQDREKILGACRVLQEVHHGLLKNCQASL